jgi:hypothetical protein
MARKAAGIYESPTLADYWLVLLADAASDSGLIDVTLVSKMRPYQARHGAVTVYACKRPQFPIAEQHRTAILAAARDLARALRLSLSERNRLLVGAGFAPLSVMQLGSWDDALQAVADVLNDATLSAEERDQFRSVVQMISARWRGQSEAVARPA